ncbi:MAG: hypothetical protein P4L82_03150 [Ancalomicrobiaceae bacterium]|nr:hypothetical protein [Ancalomicrobiaceae bacterium]
MILSFRPITLAAVLSLFAAAAAEAGSFDGSFTGASSIAGGTGECWGNAPARASVSGGQVTIRYVAYDGTDSAIVGTLKPDGSFIASQPIRKGTIAYSGKIAGKYLTANWKGPGCYGTLDLSR